MVIPGLGLAQEICRGTPPIQKTTAPEATPVCNIKHCFDTSNPRFATQGWCHEELHRCGYITQMFEQTKSKCCNGPQSDECGIGLVDAPGKRVYYNGTWHPLVSSNDISLPARAVINDFPPGFGIICGRETYTYCYSIDGGGT